MQCKQAHDCRKSGEKGKVASILKYFCNGQSGINYQANPMRSINSFLNAVNSFFLLAALSLLYDKMGLWVNLFRLIIVLFFKFFVSHKSC